MQEENTQTTDLVVQEIKLPSELIFQSLTNVGFDLFVQQQVEPFIMQQKAIVADLQTAVGRSKIISAAMVVTKQSKAMDKAVIEFAQDLELKPKEIRANLKKLKARMEEAAEEIRKPVTEFETPRKQAIEQIKNAVVFDGFKPTSEQIQARIDWLNNDVVIEKAFYADFFSDANKAKAKSESVLSEMLEKTLAEEKQAAEQAELLAKAERASWVNSIAAIGYNLAGLPEHQLMARIDQLNSFIITDDAYIDQYENAINARSTALNSVNAAIDALKEADAKAKREAELSNLKNLPVEAKNWTPEGIATKVEQLKSFNYKADYWKELYGDVIDSKQSVIAQLEALRDEKIAEVQKAIDDAKAEADALAEQVRIKAAQDAQLAIEKAAKDAKDKAEREAKEREEQVQAKLKAEQDAIDAKAKEDAERAANEQHRENVKIEAVNALCSELFDGDKDYNSDLMSQVIDLIADGKIPHVKITF